MSIIDNRIDSQCNIDVIVFVSSIWKHMYLKDIKDNSKDNFWNKYHCIYMKNIVVIKKKDSKLFFILLQMYVFYDVI